MEAPVRPDAGTATTTGQRLLRVVLITEDEPFFLANGYRRLLSQIAARLEIAAVVLLDYAPMRRTAPGWDSLRQCASVYGAGVVARCGTHYLANRWRPSHRIDRVFAAGGIPVIRDIRAFNANGSLRAIGDLEPDLIVSVAVHQIFRGPLLELAPMGCINVHLSLLPYHRGPAPVFWALHDGDAETGVTVHFIDGGIDTGAAIAQRRQPIRERSFVGLLEAQRALSMETLLEALNRLSQGDRTPIAIDRAGAPYQSWPTQADVRAFLAAGNRFF